MAFHRGALVSFLTILDATDTTPPPPLPHRPTARATATVEIPIERTGRANGLVCWMDYALDADTCVSTGPTVPGAPSYHRPSVRFLDHLELTGGGTINIEARFAATDCDVTLRVFPEPDRAS